MSKASHPHNSKRPGMSTATWIILSIMLLISLAIHHSIYETVLKPGFQTAPVTEPIKPALPKQISLPRQKSSIDTSIDSIHEFDEPPLFAEPLPELENTLQDSLTKKQPGRVSLGGKIFFDEESTLERPAIDGALVEIGISTP